MAHPWRFEHGTIGIQGALPLSRSSNGDNRSMYAIDQVGDPLKFIGVGGIVFIFSYEQQLLASFLSQPLG